MGLQRELKMDMSVSSQNSSGNPQQRQIALTTWQSRFYVHPARYKVACCGRRSGKTTFAKIDLYLTAMKNPGWKIWYVATTYGQAYELMWEELVGENNPNRMFPEALVRKKNVTKLKIELINGTTIWLKGSDNTESLLGAGIHKLYLDEYQSQHPDVWYKLRPMLSDYKGKVVVLGTPRSYNHFYDMWWKGWHENPNKSENWHSVQITTEQAGTIAADEIDDARSSMSPKHFAQEYLASFESLDGVVYDCFDPRHNVRSDITLRPQDEHGDVVIIPFRIGMDFNVNPMTACIGVIINKELHICEEIYLENSNTREMIKQLKHKYDGDNLIVYPDPAGSARGTSAKKGETNHSLLQQAGFTLKGHNKAHPPIVDRVNEVNAMLCNAKGERRLFVHPRCVHLIKALKGQVYDKNGEPDKSSGLDHPVDGLGYLVHQEFPINKASARQYSMMGY